MLFFFCCNLDCRKAGRSDSSGNARKLQEVQQFLHTGSLPGSVQIIAELFEMSNSVQYIRSVPMHFCTATSATSAHHLCYGKFRKRIINHQNAVHVWFSVVLHMPLFLTTSSLKFQICIQWNIEKCFTRVNIHIQDGFEKFFQ